MVALQLKGEVLTNFFHQTFQQRLDATGTMSLLFETNETMTYERFVKVAEHHIQTHKGTVAFEFLPNVSYAERASYEARANEIYAPWLKPDEELVIKGLGIRDGVFGVYPSPREEYYLPVFYVHPIETNLRAVLLDSNSDYAPQEALNLARDSKALVITAPIDLIQATLGILCVAPVDGQNDFVISVYTFDEIVRATLDGNIETSLYFLLYDRTDKDIFIMQGYRLENGELQLNTEAQPFEYKFESLTFTAEFGNRSYAIVVYGGAGFQNDSLTLSIYMIVSVGLLFGLTIFGLYIFFYKSNKVDKELREAEDKAKIRVIGFLCHELRNPTHAILHLLSSVYTLCEKEQREVFDQVNALASCMMDLLNTTLEFPSDTRSIIKLSPQESKFSQVVKDVFQQYTLMFKRDAELDFVLRIDDTMEHATLMVDPVRLRQILVNAITNSLKYTDQGEIVVTYALPSDNVTKTESGSMTENEVAPGRFFELSVSDTGTGLGDVDPETLFQDFKQGKIRKKTIYTEHWLGITNLSRNCDLHGRFTQA